MASARRDAGGAHLEGPVVAEEQREEDGRMRLGRAVALAVAAAGDVDGGDEGHGPPGAPPNHEQEGIVGEEGEAEVGPDGRGGRDEVARSERNASPDDVGVVDGEAEEEEADEGGKGGEEEGADGELETEAMCTYNNTMSQVSCDVCLPHATRMAENRCTTRSQF